MLTPKLKPREKQRLRAFGHQLKPIVTIADQGLTEGVLNELDRAFNDHELIKIKINISDRQIKQDMIKQVSEVMSAELIQNIGKTALLLRRAAVPNPKLSNLARAQTP